MNDSKIINCIFQGDIYVDDLHFFGSSEYTNKTGGFVGLNTTSGTVEHSSANTDSIYVRTFSYAGGTAYTFGYLQRAQTECSCTNNRIFFEANYLEWGGRETVRQDFDGEGYQKNAHKHQYQMTSVLPTCTEEGTVSYLCESCSDVIEEQSIPAMGHKYGEELIVTPTYEERGYTHKICSRCGYDYKYNYVEAYKIETGSCGSNATYTMDTGKGTVIISGTGAINNYNSGYNSIKKVYRTTAPWGSYDIKSVVIEDGITSIGNYAFFRNEEIEEVSLPSTLQSVGTSAFYGAALSSLELPQGLTTISNSALGGIKKLTEIEIPDSVTDIGKTAFTGCTNLERVTLPCSAVLANSTDNYNDVFYNCNKLNTLYFTKGTGSMPDYETVSPFKAISGTLTEVSFAECVDYIGQNTFRDCSKLETVNMPLTQPVIGKDAFKGTPYYKSTFDEKGLIISGTILCDGMYAEGDVVIPDGITEISNDAFKNNKNITSIIIPESVKTVGASVFYGCTGLSSLTVPCDLDLYFDDNSFYGVTHLTTLTMTKGSGVMLSFGSKYLYTPWFRSSAVFSTINLEEGITEIGSSAFRDLPNLTSVSIPSSVTRLGTYAFSGDSSIQSIALPDGFDYFGAAALNNCTGLKELTLPCSTRFANNANNFGNCTNIEKITLTKGTGVMPSYKDIFRLTPWYISRVNLKQLVLEDGIENIGAFMFIYNSSLTDLEMPNSIKTIGASAFDHCTSLNRLIIPKGVTEIQSSAFNGCSKLNEIVFLGNCLDSVGSSAFSTTNKKQRMYFIDKNCVINAAGNVLPTIAGYAKSTAQAYAETYSKTFFEIIGQCSECDSYNLTRKTVEPTCTLDGYYEYSCGSCGYHYTEDGDLPAKGHTLVTDDDKPATCTDTGLTAGLHCSVCGEVFKEQEIIPTTGHTTVIDKAKPATCTKTGLTEGSHCSVCGEVIKAQEIIPATGHTAVIDKAKPATCNETGLTEGSHCSVCGEVIKAQEIISATGHTVVIDKAKPATCTKTGLTEGSHCSVCGEVIIAQEIIPAIGHTIAIDDAVPATCTHTGLTSGAHCSVCGEILVAQEVVPMAEHTIVIDNAKTPTCTETGLTEGSHCSVCGEVIKAQSVIPATGHTEVIDNGKAPTCTETGLTDGSHCSVCGEIIKAQEVILAAGHTMVIDKAKAPTCTETGLTEGSHCSVCGEIIKAQEIIPAKHHTPAVDEAKPATCTETGLTEGYHCSVCGIIAKVQEVIPAKGHTLVLDKGKAPTCTETGLTEGSHCSVCGEIIKTQNIIPATGHTEVIDKGKAPTCTETGLTDGSHCSVCGEIIKAQEIIPSAGHTEVIDKSKAPTCTENGLTDGSHCSVCGEIIKAQEIIPATGHDWGNGTVTKAADCHHDGEMTYSCSKCQEKKTEVIPMLEHQWDDGTVTKEPTYTEPGEIKYTCSLCGDTLTESVPCKEKKGKLTISNETVRAGDEVTVKLYLDENPGITALSINVNFPNRFILKDVQYMGLFPNQPSSSPMNYNPFTISWASPTSTDIDNTGLFAILTFDVGIDVPLADYPITVTYNAENVFDSAFVNVPLDIENSTVSVLKPTPGDVNRDGNINMKDLVLIQQLINRWDVQIVESAADVNDDGEINMKDLVLLQRYINGWEVVLK